MGDDLYYYDESAANRVIAFVERYLIHFQGRFAGRHFKLLQWQREMIGNLFGWKRKVDGLRRYQELFILTAKGAGKTPLLTAIGLYMLLGDGEAAPHVISMASSFEQANLTFEAATLYIQASAELSEHCLPKQYKIEVPQTHGKWTLVSGKPTGRSGSSPTCCICDEAHEWGPQTAKAYSLIEKNLFKRQQPLLLVATNAPTGRTTFAYQLYDRAKRVLEGKSQEERLLPIIHEAPFELDWTSEEAARAANPSIPEIVTFEQLRPQVVKAKENPDAEAEYRRLYLSQQVQSSKKWLDVKSWDTCTAALDLSKLKDGALYVGIDLAPVDDMCAVTYVWPTSTTLYVDSHFWLPRATALHYQTNYGTPYEQWEKAGYITLVDAPTISEALKKQIAETIIARAKPYKLKAICYDRYKADSCIACLEAARLTCVPIGQGWGVSRGCEELERRLKESSISIAPNDCLRSCAELVEVKHDDRGNFWPCKANASGKFAGKRHEKIDGISSLVTALTEARKASFPNKGWSGGSWIV